MKRWDGSKVMPKGMHGIPYEASMHKEQTKLIKEVENESN